MLTKLAPLSGSDLINNTPELFEKINSLIEEINQMVGMPKPIFDPGFVMERAKAELTAAERKTYPVYSGLLKYFPDALMEVAHVSKVGNDQHNPGQPLHWAREKSTDQLDALARHLTDHANGKRRDPDGERILGKVAWRALAELQLEIEREKAYVEPKTGFEPGSIHPLTGE